MISDQWNGPSSLQSAATLLGVAPIELHRALLFKSFAAARGRTSITSIPLSLIAATENCEGKTFDDSGQTVIFNPMYFMNPITLF